MGEFGNANTMYPPIEPKSIILASNGDVRRGINILPGTGNAIIVPGKRIGHWCWFHDTINDELVPNVQNLSENEEIIVRNIDLVRIRSNIALMNDN